MNARTELTCPLKGSTMRPWLFCALLLLIAGTAFGQPVLTTDINPSYFEQQVTLTVINVPPFKTVSFLDGGPAGSLLGTNINNSEAPAPISFQISTLSVG